MQIPWQDVALSLTILAVAVVLATAARRLLRWAGQHVRQRTHTELDERLIQAVAFPAQVAIFLLGLKLAISGLSFVPEDWTESIDRLFFAANLLIVYLVLYRLIGTLISWYSEELSRRTYTRLDDRFLTFIRHTATILATVVAVILLLERFGIEANVLITTLGVGSLAVALAAQETLRDVIAGFMIALDSPFKPGDRIEVLDIDAWGDVVEIGLRSTRILTRDNRLVSIPNSVIGTNLVVNYSVPSTKYRVQTHVGVAYGSDVERVRQLLIAAICAQPWVMQEEPVEALLLELGDSALIFRVRCWIEHYVETRRIIDKMNTALYQALNEAGISIPFPQRTVHIASSMTHEPFVDKQARDEPSVRQGDGKASPPHATG